MMMTPETDETLHWPSKYLCPTPTGPRFNEWAVRCSCGDEFDTPVKWWEHAGYGGSDERARIVQALAAIHRPEHREKWQHQTFNRLCVGCGGRVDSDGDCPTMRIAKGKP